MVCGQDADWGRSPAPAPETAGAFVRELLADEATREALETHTHLLEEFVNREALEALLHWRLVLELLAWTADRTTDAEAVRRPLGGWLRAVLKVQAGAAVVGYRTEELLNRLDSHEKKLPTRGA